MLTSLIDKRQAAITSKISKNAFKSSENMIFIIIFITKQNPPNKQIKKQNKQKKAGIKPAYG